MAAKLSIEERAKIALGDFGFTNEALFEKMAEIFAEEARARGLDDDFVSLARALICRDGDLSAMGMERLEDAFIQEEKKEDDAAIETAAHNFASIYSSLRGTGVEQAEKKPAEKKRVKVHRRVQADKVQKEMPKPKEEKRGRGRPRKHETGSQTSIWFSDSMRAAVNQRALVWHCSFSDAVNKLLRLAIKNKY